MEASSNALFAWVLKGVDSDCESEAEHVGLRTGIIRESISSVRMAVC